MYFVHRYSFLGQTVLTFFAACLFFVLLLGFWLSYNHYQNKTLIENTANVLNVIQGVVTQEHMSSEYSVNVSRFLRDLSINPKVAHKGMRIKEIFLLNTKGRLLAHSRAVRMSKIEERKYQLPMYQNVLVYGRSKPYTSTVLGYQNSLITKYILIFAKKLPPLTSFINIIVPSRIPVEYLISSISYNEKLHRPIGSLHIIAAPLRTSAMIDPIEFYSIHYGYLLGILVFMFIVLWKLSIWKVDGKDTRDFAIQNIEIPVPNPTQIIYQGVGPEVIYHKKHPYRPIPNKPTIIVKEVKNKKSIPLHVRYTRQRASQASPQQFFVKSTHLPQKDNHHNSINAIPLE